MHGQRYIPEIRERMAPDEIVTEHLGTHLLPLDQGQHGYDIFKAKGDGNVRPVFLPNG